MKKKNLQHVVKATKQRTNVYVVIFFFLAISILFILGYYSGFHDANRPAPTATDVVATDVPFKANFTVTEAPPDESSWQAFSSTSHYHIYSLRIPANYHQTSDDKGVEIFEDDNGSTITIAPQEHATIKKPTLRIDGSPVIYAGKSDKDIETDSANFDLSTENILISYRGEARSHFISIVNTFNDGPIATLVPVVPKIIEADLATIFYPSSDIADSLTKNTTNCHNKEESLLHFLSHSSLTTLDINTCAKTNTYDVKSATQLTINKQTYAQVLYTDKSVCYLSKDTPSLKALFAYPVKSWHFAPKVSNLHDNPSELCITSQIRGDYPTTQDMKDAQGILKNILFN